MLVALDERDDYGEDRWIGIGLLGSWVVVVIYTEPDAETIRIISLRKALSYERADMNKPSATHWERVDALSDADIDTSDIPPLDEAFFCPR